MFAARSSRSSEPLARHGIPARARLGISQNPSLALSFVLPMNYRPNRLENVRDRPSPPSLPSSPTALTLSGKQLFGPMGGEAEEGDVSARDTRFRGEGGSR